MWPGTIVYKDGLEGVILLRDDFITQKPRILVEHGYACRWYPMDSWSEEPPQVVAGYMELFQ